MEISRHADRFPGGPDKNHLWFKQNIAKPNPTASSGTSSLRGSSAPTTFVSPPFWWAAISIDRLTPACFINRSKKPHYRWGT